MKGHEKLERIINPQRMLAVVFLLLAFQSAHGFIVRNTADSGPGSLREAILLANANHLYPDLIIFGIKPAGGIKTIVLQSDLPPITDIVTIDGWSQISNTYKGPPVIEVRGGGGKTQDGLVFTGKAKGSVVRGLIINGFPFNGLIIDAPNVTVQGCYIGTSADGNSAIPNNLGIYFKSALGKGLIGGPNPHDRNVISGNTVGGIALHLTGGGNRIEGNYIGLSASGLTPVGNGEGVVTNGFGNTIGGLSPGSRNVISGNKIGVTIEGQGNRVQGNYIGVAPDGVTPMGNQVGVDVSDPNNFIGGGTVSAGNVISANIIGINLSGASGTQIQNNLIGVGADRTTPLGNQTDGILIGNGDGLNLIGGLVKLKFNSAPAGNVIAFNGRSGIRVEKSSGNLISVNSIHDNVGPGIDLLPEGVTANDSCDTDTGPNDLQNFPLISSVSSSNGTITIKGSVFGKTQSTPFGKLTYRLEFFRNAACNASGHGEGATFLGELTVLLPVNACQVDFTATLTGALSPGEVITATATDQVNNTSEFSPCAFVGPS